MNRTGTVPRDRVDVEAIRATHPIAEVVAASGVQLSPRGRGFMGCCPFHDDATPSLSVGGVPGRFHCFGCGAHGDVIDYVTGLTGLPFLDAARALTDGLPLGRHNPLTARIAVPTPVATVRELTTAPDRAYEINQLAWEHLTTGPALERAETYMRDRRGIDLTALRGTCGGDPVVGYAGASWRYLTRHLHAHGVSDTELVDLDLARPARSGELVDSYRGRLILPVRDQSGRISGFIGRDTTGNPRAPKYRNPTRTPVFDKSTTLYRPTLQALDGDATVVVVEGALDALAIAAAAATNGQGGRFGPCTTSGVTASPTQAGTVLGLHPLPPVIALDGDDAGHQGTARWLHLLCVRGARPALVTVLPGGADPASWLAEHGPAGLAAFERRHPLDSPVDEVVPHLPGRELVQLCVARSSEPVSAALASLTPIAAQLPAPAAQALIAQAEDEMTRHGWNPDDQFSRALRRAVDTVHHQHGRPVPGPCDVGRRHAAGVPPDLLAAVELGPPAAPSLT